MNGTNKDDAPDAAGPEAFSPLQSMILQVFRIGAWGAALVAMLYIMHTPS
jgi:hypothetical protein